MGGRKTVDEDLRQTLGLEIAQRTVRPSNRFRRTGIRTVRREADTLTK
jgi:hypothetical protein